MNTNALLVAGLVISLLGPLFVMLLTKWMRLDSLALGTRLVLWGIAVLVVQLAVGFDRDGLLALGLKAPSISTLFFAGIGAMLVLAVSPVVWLVQRALGLPWGDRGAFERLVAHSLRYRAFIVITAAVVEEVLYRGYAIGVGQRLVVHVISK